MAEHEITLTRRFKTSADNLYAAWTDPSVMRQWLGRNVDADVRVGGRYRIENDGGDGTIFVHSGEYRVLEPGRRIVQTFKAGPAGSDQEQPTPYINEYLEVQLKPWGPGETELTFINGWDGEALSAEDQNATREAWSSWLDLLDSVL